MSRISYLENEANNYYNENKNNFEQILKPFMINEKKLSKAECENIHKNYHIYCNFDNLISFSYIFKPDRRGNILYDYYSIQLNTLNTRDGFINIYKYILRNIYNKIFNIDYKWLSHIDIIYNNHDYIIQLYNCINFRLQYHYYCRKYTIKYNIYNHEQQLFFAIYMYNRIIDLKNLLNTFNTCYKLFKYNNEEKIKQTEEKIKQTEEKNKQIEKQNEDYNFDTNEEYDNNEDMNEEYDNIDNDSSTIKEEPFKNNNNDRRSKQKKINIVIINQKLSFVTGFLLKYVFLSSTHLINSDDNPIFSCS